jgi:hypothetical protein
MAENFDQIKKRRQDKAAQRNKENAELAREQQNLKVVEQLVPENQKAKGSAKFGQLILKLGLQIFNQFQPQILLYIKDYASPRHSLGEYISGSLISAFQPDQFAGGHPHLSGRAGSDVAISREQIIFAYPLQLNSLPTSVPSGITPKSCVLRPLFRICSSIAFARTFQLKCPGVLRSIRGSCANTSVTSFPASSG